MTTRNVHIVNYIIVNFRQKLYVLLTIKPWDGHDLHENGEHDGSSGGECIQYLKHVHPSLHTEITTYQLSILHPCTSYEIKQYTQQEIYNWTCCWQNEYKITMSEGHLNLTLIIIHRLKFLTCNAFYDNLVLREFFKVFKNL